MAWPRRPRRRRGRGPSRASGRRGAEPTHPELLDHLAARFVRDGWSIKRLVRYLVTSKSWQLAATPPPGAAAADPEAAWLTHAPTRRLTAEALRDSLFAVAGALEEGGAGAPFGANSTTPRRSVYVRTKRNDLDAFLAAAAVRGRCCSRSSDHFSSPTSPRISGQTVGNPRILS